MSQCLESNTGAYLLVVQSGRQQREKKLRVEAQHVHGPKRSRAWLVTGTGISLLRLEQREHVVRMEKEN